MPCLSVSHFPGIDGGTLSGGSRPVPAAPTSQRQFALAAPGSQRQPTGAYGVGVRFPPRIWRCPSACLLLACLLAGLPPPFSFLLLLILPCRPLATLRWSAEWRA